jgi:hypothetical protein
MRSKTIEYIYQKEILDFADSGYLTVDTSAPYIEGDYLHDGIISFSNVFPELVDSWIELKEVRILEEIRGSGSLVKPEVYLYLFPSAKALPTITKNNPFAYSDIWDITYPFENLLQRIKIAVPDWTYEHTETNIRDAMAVKSVSAWFRSDGSQNLYGIIVANSASIPPFSSNAKVKVQLIYKHL